MRANDLFKFIRARHCIWLMRDAGNRKPWTGDPILQNYRFCNVYRELDTVTQWIAKNWRKPNAKDNHLWFAMVVARFINNTDTMVQLGYPTGLLVAKGIEGWGKHFLSVVNDRQRRGLQVYGGAYTISTNGRAMPKHEYLLQHVFDPLWVAAERVEGMLQTKGLSLQAAHAGLLEFQGLGSFMAAQVIADLKYAQLKKADDWWTWAASGPGSRRGLVRVQCPTAAEGGERKDTPWREDIWLQKLQELHKLIEPMVAKQEYPRLHAQDLQNCLCEFDKYERVMLGEGRPRSRYPGAA